MSDPSEEPETEEVDLEEEDDAEEEDTELEPSAQVEASYEELFGKRGDAEEEEEESLLEMTREERIESLNIRTVPKQANEFVCSNCHLVKNKSQLADRKRILCRDCV